MPRSHTLSYALVLFACMLALAAGLWWDNGVLVALGAGVGIVVVKWWVDDARRYR
jgi:hypothetical protein